MTLVSKPASQQVSALISLFINQSVKTSVGRPGGGGGGVLKKVLYGEAPPQVLTPYPFIYHFWQKLYPFRIPLTENRYPFHIPKRHGVYLK